MVYEKSKNHRQRIIVLAAKSIDKIGSWDSESGQFIPENGAFFWDPLLSQKDNQELFSGLEMSLEGDLKTLILVSKKSNLKLVFDDFGADPNPIEGLQQAIVTFASRIAGSVETDTSKCDQFEKEMRQSAPGQR